VAGCGKSLIQRIEFLRKYSIPEPVAGGLLAAVFVAVLHAMGVRITFDTDLQPGLMLAFFATIGLGADARMIASGGGPLLRFTVCVIGMLLLENLIGVGTAKLLGMDPLIGLVLGSVTMAGGHGTGAAWGQRFSEQFGLAQAPALALASATFGLILGGIIGGPVAMRLIRRLQARGEPCCATCSPCSGSTKSMARHFLSRESLPCRFSSRWR
jgi:ESS family glutamate:Na+ symporter